MSIYVKEGKKAEEDFVRMLNKEKMSNTWQKLSKGNTHGFFAIRVSTKKYSKVHKAKIFCKSDIFIAKGNIDKKEMKKRNFFLDEEDVSIFGLQPQIGTGISVKKLDATAIQWQKLGIDGVGEIFGHTELGAGVSLYRQKGTNHNTVEESLEQNSMIVQKWCEGWERFERFYPEIRDVNLLKNRQVDSNKRCEIAKKIVEIADEKIKKQIDDNKEIQQKIFWGKGVFEEPFCASWVYENGDIQATKDYFPKYTITTGSSRTTKFNIAIKGC